MVVEKDNKRQAYFASVQTEIAGVLARVEGGTSGFSFMNE